MKYNPDLHHRRSVRLRGYNYANAGTYFVTMCCKHRECLLNGARSAPPRLLQSPSNSVGAIIRGYKCAHTPRDAQTSSNMAYTFRNNAQTPRTFADISIWQRNYYERIINDEIEYARIANYIKNNPILWEKDCFYANNNKAGDAS